MDYILLATLAWVIFGVVSIQEKFLLQKPLKDPNVLAFYTGIFSIFVILIFLPFARFSSWTHLIFDLTAGIIFFIAQYCLYHALKEGEVSEVVPITGALIPIFSIIIVHFGLGTYFYSNEWIALALLIAGTILISYKKIKRSKNLIIYAILASLMFAVYYSMAKLAYTPFKTNFSFVRIGSFLAALIIFLIPEVRASIKSNAAHIKNKSSGLFITKEVLAGVAFVVLNYAISIGNPAIANSLEGFEYVFIFLVIFFGGRHLSKTLSEHYDREALIRKFIAIILIFAGLIFLNT
ncbi:MAG: hypothetical protein JWO40_371 [Candidatus Doudnabacteria bacterium]|nr:hypothetical protein [Candidatus Doudnabacteria bacterium]